MYPEAKQSLYDPKFEHDACGVGFVANINGKQEHRVLALAIEALCNLAHRGALDADAKTGDGAGVLFQLPKAFFRKEVEAVGGTLHSDEDLAVGFIFTTLGDSYQISTTKKIVNEALEGVGLHVFGWRDVPTNASVLGDKAKNTQPEMLQVLIGRTGNLSPIEFERKLFLARKRAEKAALEAKIKEFYVPSMSSRTIVYKGMFNAPQLPKFFTDLENPQFITSLAIYHQRYSTNTFPNWNLAHPFRMAAHNGEINTLLGNKNWTRAREREIHSEVWGDQIDELRPIIQENGSDSAAADNAMEVLELSGRDIVHTALMLAPEAWEKTEEMDSDIRAFYKYHACLNEPWDGPAAIVFSDGRTIGATLDRNGLRPARYEVYKDGLIVMGSEIGVVDLPEDQVVKKGRLGPGRILAVDTEAQELILDEEIKKAKATAKPYKAWCDENMFSLTEHAKPFNSGHAPVNLIDHTLQQIAFGWDSEEINIILRPMAEKGMESIGSMGDDTPLAVLSKKPKLLYYYFKQLFAQVTNPPIDSIRERIVMSLSTCMGHRNSWLEETPDHARVIRLDSPFLLDFELESLRNLPADEGFQSATLACHFAAKEGTSAMKSALDALCDSAENAIDDGACILILSDRGVDAEKAPIPMLLAVGAVHHHLIHQGKRMRASIICETGEARDVQNFACLIGYGASAINPYVAIDTIREDIESGEYSENLTMEAALANYRKAIENGILKIMSKMGISTISSYRGAQIFEAIGISDEVIDHCFFGTTSQIGGVTFDHIAGDTLRRHQAAFASPEEAALDEGGNYKVLSKGRGEFHAFNKPVVQTLHKFLRKQGREEFEKYLETVEARDPVTPRDLLQFRESTPIPIDEVEPIENIRVRFTTAGMSLGALSEEAHECLAIAMNRIGGKSNSGEGGEDRRRFKKDENGDSACSAIKQVASGRFGVTPEYLASAQEIEIKMAQGAKPGEGGQLPGHKVSVTIAKLRHSTPGVPLISPPPHHDIYSIEDLAQLIYDLKQVNPRAKVCVKLVAEAGVGTVAAGVAKAYADVVLISGHDGGTGASPMSSIKHAGLPFELGVAEAHQTLMLNDLRSRIVLRTDGGIKTGSDIVKAALLGAEEFNFGTAALIATGCAMFRVCHLNTCPVGVATQKEELRLKFRGKPENVVAFFDGVAEEVRQLMAQLGFRKFDDLVGRADLLERKASDFMPEEIRSKVENLDLSKLLYMVDKTGASPRIHTRERNERFGDSTLDDRIIVDAKDALNGGSPIKLNYKIKNTDRNIGTKLSGQIGFQYGDAGLRDGTIDITLTGSVGQSFATFLANGVNITLLGEANDYVGKGMNGGQIVIRPQEVSSFEWAENQIAGNTVLYGATGGRLFAAGRAGERFCVRNSGATAVVEGVGDHGCEYMTGGVAIVLGSTGRNFAAGMSGGRAYIYDPDGEFEKQYNKAMVSISRFEDQDEEKEIQGLIYAHLENTESPLANEILKGWKETSQHFWRVIPHAPAAMPSQKPVHELEKDTAKPTPTGGF